MIRFYVPYLILMNGLGLLTMFIDKQLAQKGHRRISEKVLFSIALLGGCFGSYFSMRVFHHKTRHGLFSTGLPILMILHSALMVRIFLY